MSRKKGIYPWIKSIFGKADPPASGVYAGPEIVYRSVNGGEPGDDDDPCMEEVYAGPEFFERPGGEQPAEEIEVPDCADGGEAAGEDSLPPEAPRDPREFMCVYAGPEYFRNRANAAKGMLAGIKTVKCRECEKEYPQTNAVCPGCGARTVFEDGTVACPSCGAHAAPGAKFCDNCGAKLE